VTLIPTGPVETGSVLVKAIIHIPGRIPTAKAIVKDYVHTVTIEYAPFPAIAPTTDVVDCYANIVLPAPPVITDNCGVTLTPTGPVETGSVVCEGIIHIPGHIQTAKENAQDYVHTVTIEYAPFPAIAPTSDVVDCYANIVLPAPPVVTDNCGVTLTPTGPVETGSVVCEGVLYIYLDIYGLRRKRSGLSFIW
jgi:hypothetical protein